MWIPSGTNVPTQMVHRASRVTPWHDASTPIADGVSPIDALGPAGQDFAVGTVPVLGEYPLGPVEIENYKALVRLDESGMPACAPWAVVSDRYRDISNRAVAEFLGTLGEVAEGVQTHTAGVFRGGRKCWWLVDIGGSIIVPGNEVRHNLFVVNAHDGTMALRFGETDIDIVCENTCQHALDQASDAGKNIGIRHVGDVLGKMEDAARILKIARNAADRAANLYRGLADTSVTVEQVNDILVQTFAGDSTRAKNVRGAVADLFTSSPTIAGFAGREGTAWGLFSAVTEYVDHFASSSKSPTERIYSGWFGAGADTKQEALQAIRLVTAKKVGPEVLSV